MTAGLDLPGVTLAPGDHLCGFYYGEDERDALLFPFLRTGLRSGEKCLAVVDSTTPADVVERIGPDVGPDPDSGAPVDVAACLATGQLELYDSQQTYLRTGRFDADLMIEFWEEQARRSSEQGLFTFARVVGEMSWLERVPPEREAVVKYETWADEFAAAYPHAVLCLYDVRRLGSGIMFDLLKTHPKLLLGGLVLENPHHISGEEFVAAQV